MNSVVTYEELSLSEWPALETQFLDGWVLRFSNGYTKRANSVNPLYQPQTAMTLERRVTICESLYEAHGLPTLFKLTEESPLGLDGFLEARNYRLLDPSMVMVHPELPHQTQDIKPGYTISWYHLDDQDWLHWYADEKSLSTSEKEAFFYIATKGAGLGFHGFLRAPGGEIMACATGIVNRGTLGILNVHTVPKHRRKGYSRLLMGALIARGAQHGAGLAYLQVFEANEAARNLYSSLDFAPAYRYWYRTSAM